MAHSTDSTTTTLTIAQQQALREFSTLLTTHGVGPRRLLIIDAHGQQTELPPATLEALAPAVTTVTAALAHDPSLALLANDIEVSPTRAARLLHISRQYLTLLLEQDAFPSRKVGSHHRIRVGDLRAFKARQRAAIQEIAQISEELGLYDE